MSHNHSTYYTGYNTKGFTVDTANGQHQYDFVRDGSGGWTAHQDLNWALASCTTITRWDFMKEASCIHQFRITTDVLDNGNAYAFTNNKCFSKLDHWDPVCVDCGNYAFDFNFYCDRSQLGRFVRFNQVNGSFWFSCAYCTGGNQGRGTEYPPHNCNWVSYNKYNVNYNANGGTGTTNATTHIYNNGTQQFEIKEVYNVNADAGLKTYTYQYNGKKLSTATNKLATNGFVRDGYTFMGWSTNANRDWKDLDFSSGTGDYQPGQEILNLAGKTRDNYSITLYAVWKRNTWDVIYKTNEPAVTESVASGVMPNKTTISGEGTILDLNQYSLTGYIWQGWSTSSSGEVEYVDGAEVQPREEDLILYAVWKPIEYDVNIHNNKPDDATSDVVNIK